MSLSLVQRLLQTLNPRPLQLMPSLPAAVQPPLPRRTASWQRRLGAWLVSSPAHGALASEFDNWQPSAVKVTELVESRATFRTLLDDIPMLQSDACLANIRAARSMHELWHLRPEVFNLVSRNRSQAEAMRRLAVLDLHFPNRARRGF